MNSNIQHLYNIAGKPQRTIIGLMSGTSLDGLDIALCNISGSGIETKLELLQFDSIAYTNHFKKEVRSVFSKKEVNLEKLTLLNSWIALQHAGIINQCLRKWSINKDSVDLIASHGQSIYHAPASLHKLRDFGNATLQIGDGDHLAVATGVICISDFRQKNIAAGGEGAPLAGYGDYFLFRKQGEERVLLNIGGIANFTYLPGHEEGKMICTDTGPGNCIMDAYMQEQFPGKFYDENAAVANTGLVNIELLNELKSAAFFNINFPKTTGPELFNLAYLQNAKMKTGTINLPVADTMATLNKFTADTIAAAIGICVKEKKGVKIFISGGGIHNPKLMDNLKIQLPGYIFNSTASTGINPDAKEAILFALLANECVAGNHLVFKNQAKQIIPVSMGKISFPY